MNGPRQFRLSPRARADIQGIHRYISENNPKAAGDIVRLISHKIEWVAESGFDGVPRGWIRPDLRALPLRGKYCIYFTATDTLVTILRVLHGARDINAEMFAETVL